MKLKVIYLLSICLLLVPVSSIANDNSIASSANLINDDTSVLENPISVQYLKKHLRKNTPRLILTPAIEKQLKKELRTNPVVQNMYKAVKLNAQQIMKEPLLEHKKIGRRLLHVSREMLYRMNILSIIYAIEKDHDVLNRINKEIIDVCNFKDWNPSHFLDVAEMSMAVAIALDWTEGDLPKSTIELAKTALIEKGIKPSYGKNMWWINGTNNWNQVCNGGMIAASITIAEKDPELAAKTISRSLNGMPHALKEYAPDGVYPEGPTYWRYGTTFSALTASMLQSAFDTDFGLSEYHPLMESAVFRLLGVAPSGDYYNFSDCGLKRGEDGDLTLAWFAAKTGDENYFEKQRFLRDPGEMGKLARYAGAGLIWISQFESKDRSELQDDKLPLVWKGKGPNPVVFFRGGKSDPHHYYFGAKGGQANHSHGNMDAGSFIFELDGVRWVVDPGTQDYYDVEKTGFDLWGMCQKCDRWKLLTKNNFGHSTITINDAFFDVNGFVPIINFKKGDQPEVTFDMTKLYDGNVKKLTRKFIKPNNQSLLIEDHFEVSDSTKMITWQLITQANVEVVKNGVVLQQDGKQLNVDVLSPSDITASVIELNPPPLKIDKKMDHLKRVELRIPAWTVKDGRGIIKVRLSGNQDR